ncbi:MAG: CpsD/CapB family tyrosine-protein kinase [Pseudomonadota bacterium]
MGQIEEALRKAKEMHARGGGTAYRTAQSSNIRTPSNAARADGIEPFDSALAKNLGQITLDADIMERSRVVTGVQNSGANSTYKMLRTRLLQQLRANNWSRIAVCSPRANAGKTLTAINTAISLSHEPNQQVVLVDFDLRRPSVAKYLGISNSRGISDYLNGQAGIEDVVFRTNIERLMVAPNRLSFDNSSELLSSPKLIELVDVLTNKHNSSIVLFDLPPLLDADDLLAFSPHFDAVLLVVAERETSKADLQKSAHLIADMDVIGVVLNKARSEDFATGYY